MAKEIGSPKTGGRQKGTPNKKTEALQNTLANHNFDIVEKLLELMPKLKEEKQAEILLGLMNYVYPKKKSMEISIEKEKEPTVVVYIPSNGREVQTS